MLLYGDTNGHAEQAYTNFEMYCVEPLKSCTVLANMFGRIEVFEMLKTSS